MSGHQANEENNSERRSFLGAIAGLIGAGISAVMGVTIGRFAIAPAFSSGAAADAKNWTDLGPLSGIEEGKLVKKSIIVSQEAGWGQFNSQKAV
ncbi:MAG TPA: hypothetical protein PLD20_26180, partial [Blastocatellia bacterium]|nr:hypothetical protein [Blastocatellia bacterium]